MIECPFCNETFREEDLVFEFNWGEVANYFYTHKKVSVAPAREFKERNFYTSFKFDMRGRPILRTCSSVINPEKHSGLDPMCTERNGWNKIVRLLSEKKVFELECDDNDRTLPVLGKILPLVKESKKQQKRGIDPMRQDVEGVSTGIFCPKCEQQLKADVLRAQKEVRILLSGRPGSGKTVYATQVISELLQGRFAQDIQMEAGNRSVYEHYSNNKNRLKARGNGFVLATNPGAVQDPYVFLLKNGKNTVRLVIQDIAGEDTENRTKYSAAVRKADMVLFCVDPWHIEEIRDYHERNEDQCNDIVKRSTGGRYTDLGGVFEQMMNVVDQKFTSERGQLAGVMLVKGDYLNPPMLSQGEQPECQMMQRPVSFTNPEDMEVSLAMRSSFIRQVMHEWDSARSFSRDVEGKYVAHNIRYFVSSSLGQSTHLRRVQSETVEEEYDIDDPNAQFMIDNGPSSSAESSGSWDYDEQVLESAARPDHVIDPIFWCLKRKGIKFSHD